MNKKLSVLLIGAFWVSLTVLAWFSPAKAMSETERRPLSQLPEIKLQTVLNGSYMKNFEDYALDQFPFRDGFRGIKSRFHTSVLRQSDNNGIYLSDGFAAAQEYPLDEESLNHVLSRFEYLSQKYLTESRMFMAIVPDKGYYLAEEAGQLAMDYEGLFSFFREKLPGVEHIDLTAYLQKEDYYRTDTHWRQEKILDAASALCEGLGAPKPEANDYTITELERPFYGVYYGQAALPMEPDAMYLLESDLLAGCSVYDYETGKTGPIYDLARLEGKDPYEVYLSGPKSLLTIENPQGQPGKELVIFRDSFGSAIAPLLIQGYARITLADIRYIQIDMLDRFLDFHGQDVLFLYSTLVLNNSETIK